MPLEIDVKVEEQVLNIGEENPFLSSIDVLDLDDSDGSEHDNYLDTDLGYFTINNLTFPHNLMEVVHRTSNATITIPTRGTSKGSYATRSRYPENLYTITIPLLNNTEEYVNLSADLIEDLKTFGFIEIKSNYLPRVEESYDIYSVDEFRININSDLDITILEIDIQPVNMSIFGGAPMSYDAGDPSNHVGDFHTVTALDELVRIGDRPTLEERQRKSSEGGSITLSPMRVSTGKLKKDMTEFRAFLEDSREIRTRKAYNNTNYHEDDIVGDFDLTFKIPYIYPKDGLLADHLVTFEDENSNVNVMDTSEETLIAEGADYRVFEMVDLRSPPLTVITEEGVEDFEGNSVMNYYQGKPEDVPERARVMKEYIVRYVPDDLAFDGSVHNIKSITYTKSYKFARHYIGNSSIPLTQYIGPKPATLSVVSHYAAPDMNNEYNVSEDVPQLFQRMLRHIDDNNKVYPMANSFNFIKIEDNGLNYIKGKYIPSESYRLASADNSNIEVYATNFIESSMDEVYDSAKFKLATEPVSSNYTRTAAELVAKYLVIANGYFAKKDFSNEKLHNYHSTLLNRLALLRKRVHAESEGRISTLDGFEKMDFIDLAAGPVGLGAKLGVKAGQAAAAALTGEGVDTGTVDPNTGGTTGSNIIIMGDSIAVQLWNHLSETQRNSSKILMTARGSWSPRAIFVEGGKETSKKNGAKSVGKVYKHAADGTNLPSQMAMLDSSKVSLKDSTVILSSGFSNDYSIKEETLAGYIVSLAKKVKTVHVLGVATNYSVSNKYGSYDGGNNKFVKRLEEVIKIAKKSANNISLGPSSSAGDKVHPPSSSHTAAYSIIKGVLG